MRITEKELSKYVEAYKSGESLESLSKRAGLSRATMTKYIRSRTEIRKPGEWKGKMAARTKERSEEWSDLGKVPDSVIAERVGCTRQNVSRLRRSLGIRSYQWNKECGNL